MFRWSSGTSCKIFMNWVFEHFLSCGVSHTKSLAFVSSVVFRRSGVEERNIFRYVFFFKTVDFLCSVSTSFSVSTGYTWCTDPLILHYRRNLKTQIHSDIFSYTTLFPVYAHLNKILRYTAESQMQQYSLDFWHCHHRLPLLLYFDFFDVSPQSAECRYNTVCAADHFYHSYSFLWHVQTSGVAVEL